MASAGWYLDPTGRFEQRYFDGTAWSSSVSRAGQQFTDPIDGAGGQLPTATASPVALHGGAGTPAGWQGAGPRSATPLNFEELQSAPEPTRSKSAIIAVVAAVAVLAIAIGLFVMRGADNKADKAADDSPATDLTIAEPGSVVTASGELLDSRPVRVQGDPLSAFASTDGDNAIGVIAPTLTGADFDGTPVTIDGRQTGPIMVVFLAHWCPHCNAEIPRLLEWKASGAVSANLQVIAVATAVSPVSPNYPPARWLDDRGWSWPVMVDESTGDGAAGVAAEAFGATGWPYFVILGSDNQVLARYSGEIEVADLQALVEQALAGDTTGPTTEPVQIEQPTVSLPAAAPTDLVVTPLIAGTGPGVQVGDDVTVHYVGVTFDDGEQFDSSYERGEPVTFTIGVGQLIEGWDVGLLGLQAGGRYQLDIPSAMAYGDDAAASGRPAGPLTFIVDIISITPG